MATITLSEDTLASNVNYSAGDTIQLGGFKLIYDVDKSDTSVILSGAGTLWMKNGGGILLGGAVPATVNVETDVLSIRGNLEFNAAAIIKFGTNVAAGSQILQNVKNWNCPTEARTGDLWAKIVDYSSANLTVTLDRDIPSLEAGDALAALPASTSYAGHKLLIAASVDHVNHTVVLSTAPVNVAVVAANNIVCVASCPLVIYNCNTGGTFNGARFIGGDFVGGDVLFSGNYGSVFHQNSAHVTSGQLTARRVCYFPDATVNHTQTLGSGYAKCDIGTLFSLGVIGAAYNCAGIVVNIGEAVCKRYGGTTTDYMVRGGIIRIGKLTSVTNAHPHQHSGKSLVIKEADIPAPWTSSPPMHTEMVIGNITYTSGGTVTLVSRVDGPHITDLSDAYYFAPATPSDEAWRTDTFHVRKGNTISFNIKAMKGSDNGSLKVEAFDDFKDNVQTWVIPSSTPALTWVNGSISWSNNSNKDCEITLKMSGTGDSNAGYMRVWEAHSGSF